MTKNSKITLNVEMEAYSDEALLEPKADFYIINALGDIVWLKVSKKDKAQAYVDQEYGKGKYTVKALKLEKAKDNLTAR